MRLYEFEGKRLLASAGVPVGRSRLLKRGRKLAEQAQAFAREVGGPVVLKAQILRGGRGKAGGIRFADTPEQAGSEAETLMAAQIHGMKLHSILAEEKLLIAREYYLGLTIDEIEKQNLLILSSAGGVEVETAALSDSSDLMRLAIDPIGGLLPFQAKEMAARVGFQGKELGAVADVIERVWKCYRAYDAQLLEINPLVVTAKGEVIAGDCRMELDDDALFRQEQKLQALKIEPREDKGRPATRLEKAGAEVDKIDHRGVAGRVVEFDGDIGLIIGGGGASLTVMDAILRAGGRPANYCEIGGNPTVKKIQKLTEVIAGKKGLKCLGVITNVLSNTRVDLVARGVLKGLANAGVDLKKFPVVFRVPGSWEDDGFQILQKYGIKYFTRESTMDEAAEYLVKLRNQLVREEKKDKPQMTRM